MGAKTASLSTRVLALLVFLLFAGSWIIALFGQPNLLWMDEILSYLALSAHSLSQLNTSLSSGIEQTPPVFFNLYWLIAHLISPQVIVLKAVSICCFAATLAWFYWYVTRLIGNPLLNWLLITVLASLTYLNATLAIQIRSYAIFLLITFWYFTCIHQLIQSPGRRSLLLLHTGVGLLMCLTHNFGLFYLAAAGGLFSCLWIATGNRRYGLVIADFVLIGLLWLLIWYPTFALQAKTGALHSWIDLPTWRSFFRIAGELAPIVLQRTESIGSPLPIMAILRFSLLLFLLAYITGTRLKKGLTDSLNDPAFTLYLVAGFLYVVPIVITLVVTFTHTSLFISRYLWPTHLLVIYQLLYAFYSLLNNRLNTVVRWVVSRPTVYWAVVAFYLLVMGRFLVYRAQNVVLTPSQVMAYVDQLDRRVPVFLESSLYFLPTWYYNPQRPIYFLLDPASAFNPLNHPGASVGYYTLSGVKKQYHVPAILTLDQFNANYIPRFYVLDERINYQIERFIQNKSVRVIRRLPTTMEGITLLECQFTNPDSLRTRVLQ